MKITNYTPNYSDKRVLKRIKNVLSWCHFHLSAERPSSVHHTEIAKVFGHYANDLSKFLRSNLLQQTGTYVPDVSSYSYLLKKDGYAKLEQAINGEVQAVQEFVAHPDLVSGKFNYTDKSDRLWHPLQNLKREKKVEFWNAWGLPYDYDIVACAPTVLYQLATKMGMLHLISEPIKKYLENKDEYRIHVAQLTGCSIPVAKRLINSMFNGARLARNNYCSAYKALDYNDKAMIALQQDELLTELRQATKRMWQHIQRNTKLDLKKSSAKWSVYFKFERAFLTIINQYCDANDVRLFTEHDGFRTNKMIDKDELIALIFTKTGFNLKISGPNVLEN